MAESLPTPSVLTEEQKAGIMLVTGDANPALAKRVAGLMGIELTGVMLDDFPNSEPEVEFAENVRNKTVFVFQPQVAYAKDGKEYSAADSFAQLGLMIDALLESHAKEVIPVSTVLFGARQDRQARPRQPISIRWALQTLRASGVEDLLTLDPHTVQSLTAFGKPVDVITAQPTLRGFMTEQITGDKAEYAVVSSDDGHYEIAKLHADALGIDLIPFGKSRISGSKVERPAMVIPELEGKTCFVSDDIIGTGSTLISGAEILHASGVKRIVASAVHGEFSNGAAERLKDSPVDVTAVTDSIDPRAAKEIMGEALQVVSADQIIADSIIRKITGESVSDLVDGENYI
ncbi:MAG: ribose-phosphate diphosphokinase [Patescibacteria group bacterium]